MASVFVITRKTKSGARRYLVRYRLGGRESPIVHGGTFAKSADAQERVKVIQSMISRAEVPNLDLAARQREIVTVARAGDAFIASRIDVKPTTIKAYEKALARLGSLGRIDVQEVTWHDVQEWVSAQIADNLSPATVRKYLDVVRATLDYAERDPNPARNRNVKLPRQEREEITPPTHAEFIALVDAIGPRYRLHVLLMEATGLRIAELVSLTWGDLNAREGYVRVARNRTKGGTGGRRIVSVPDDLMEQIEALVPREDRVLDAPILTGTATGVRHAMARACAHAGLPHFHPHDLRHRFISLRVQAGWSIREVAQVAGHSKASITLDTYSHVMLDEPPEVMERVSRGASVVPRVVPSRAENDERPADADLSTESGRYWVPPSSGPAA